MYNTFIGIHIKSCRTQNNICLLRGFQKHCNHTFLGNCRKNRILTPRCLQQLDTHPSSQYKRSLDSNLDKMGVLETSSPFYQSSVFLKKIITHCPKTWSLNLLVCLVVSSIILDLITQTVSKFYKFTKKNCIDCDDLSSIPLLSLCSKPPLSVSGLL